jgi:ABC-type nitrate/sulfonate/bicarbonate transport system permease component
MTRPTLPPARPALRRVRGLLPALVLLAALIGCWQVVVTTRGVAPYLLPAPSRILDAFVGARALLATPVLTTTEEAVAGLLIGAAVGALLAIALAAAPVLRRALYPLLVASQTVPMIVLAPLLVLWFGYGLAPKVVVVALIVFFPVVVSTVAGLTGVDGEMVDLVRGMGASRLQVLRIVLVPAAVPAFFSGLRISAAYAVAGAVVGEWVGASSGLGIFIDRSKASFRVDRVFVAVVIIALLSMALFALVGLGARLASPWRYAAGAADREVAP